MQVLELNPVEINPKDYIRRMALPTDGKRLIKGDTLIMTNGKPLILLMHIQIPNAIRQAARRIRFDTARRTNGLISHSASFGYLPRNTIYRDFCTATAMANQQPEEHAALTAYAEVLCRLYEQYFPEEYAWHLADSKEKMLPEYRIGNTPFTSGIANLNNELKYHFDSGNTPGALSNMIVLKHGMAGGHLAVPAYDCVLETADNTLVIFNGQNILHGVTPIKRLTKDAYRISLVYYTMQQILQCLPPEQEMERIRKVHLEREQRRAQGQVDPNSLAQSKD